VPVRSNEQLSRFKKVAIIFVLSLALAIIIIDATLLNVSLSYLIRDLNTDIKSLQWVITAYALTIAAFTVTGGRLGDLFGRKKMFKLGAVLFAIGSLMASYSHTVGQMIIGESIIEGIGAALMMPATASLLTSTFRGPSRAMAMGIWGGIAGAASAVGPILGGYLTTNYSWRWGFRINVVVAIILLIGSVIIKEYRDEEEKPALDWRGVILSSVGLFTLVFGIIESSSYGWIKAKEIFSIAGHTVDLGSISIVLPSLILAAILLVSFVIWEIKIEKRGLTPIVSMSIFKNKQFTSSSITTTVMALGQSGLIFAMPIFFQSVRGLDAYHTGLAILPVSVAAIVVAPIAAILSRKIMPKRLIQVGLFLNLLAMLLLYRKLNIDTIPRDLIFELVIYGIGMGLVMAQISNMVMSSVSVQKAGEVSGVNNTMRQIGSSLGSAIIGAVLLTSLATGIKDGIANSTVIPNNIKQKVATDVAAESTNIEFKGGAVASKEIPASIVKEINTIAHQSTTDSARKSLLYASLFVLIGLFASIALPNKRDLEEGQT